MSHDDITALLDAHADPIEEIADGLLERDNRKMAASATDLVTELATGSGLSGALAGKVLSHLFRKLPNAVLDEQVTKWVGEQERGQLVARIRRAVSESFDEAVHHTRTVQHELSDTVVQEVTATREQLQRELRAIRELFEQRARSIVLVVDDEPMIREMFADRIEMSGYPSLQAPDAETALRLAERYPIAVALVDQMMPGPPGDQLVDALLARTNPVPSIMVTGNVSEDLQVRMAGKVAAFFAKPVSMNLVAAAVDDVVARRALAPSDLPATNATPDALVRLELDCAPVLKDIERLGLSRELIEQRIRAKNRSHPGLFSGLKSFIRVGVEDALAFVSCSGRSLTVMKLVKLPGSDTERDWLECFNEYVSVYRLPYRQPKTAMLATIADTSTAAEAMTDLYSKVSWLLKRTERPPQRARALLEQAALAIRGLTRSMPSVDHAARVVALEEALSFMHSVIDQLRPDSM